MSLRLCGWLLTWFWFTTASAFAQPPDLHLYQGRPVFQSGDTATVVVRLSHSDLLELPVSGVGFRLTFDRQRLIFLDVLPSAAFGSDTLMILTPDEERGTLSAAITQRAGSGIRGDHDVLRIRFVVIGSERIDSVMVERDESVVLLTDGRLLGLPDQETSMHVAPILVWPGDADRDGLVDENDILTIAMHYGRNGPPRPDTSMRFEPTASHQWDVHAAAHADVDGNGVVDMRDAIAVQALQLAYPAEQPVLATIHLPIADAGDQLQVELSVDGRWMGLATRYRIPHGLVMTQPPDIGPWSDSAPLLTTVRMEPETGLLGVAVTRVRGGEPLPEGDSRLRLTFDLPTGLPSAQTIDWLGAQVWSPDLGMAHPVSRVSVLRLTDISRIQDGHPSGLMLHPNHPNPFNPVTTLRYDVAEAGRIRLTVFDLAGREIAVLADSHHDAGSHALMFDASHLASGVYVCRLESESDLRIRKLTLIK